MIRKFVLLILLISLCIFTLAQESIEKKTSFGLTVGPNLQNYFTEFTKPDLFYYGIGAGVYMKAKLSDKNDLLTGLIFYNSHSFKEKYTSFIYPYTNYYVKERIDLLSIPVNLCKKLENNACLKYGFNIDFLMYSKLSTYTQKEVFQENTSTIMDGLYMKLGFNLGYFKQFLKIKNKSILYCPNIKLRNVISYSDSGLKFLGAPILMLEVMIEIN